MNRPLFVFSIVLLLLSGCGQKGALYFPEPTTRTTAQEQTETTQQTEQEKEQAQPAP